MARLLQKPQNVICFFFPLQIKYKKITYNSVMLHTNKFLFLTGRQGSAGEAFSHLRGKIHNPPLKPL